MMIILDSYAFLAFLEGAAGEQRVAEILWQAQRGEQTVVISLINLGEVLYITERRRGLFAAQEVLSAIQQLPVQIVEVDQRQVLAAAHIKANYPVSYADAFTISAAQFSDGTILTGDPEFHTVENIVKVEWLQ
jgi:predicted nucleic acid-binding protein